MEKLRDTEAEEQRDRGTEKERGKQKRIGGHTRVSKKDNED